MRAPIGARLGRRPSSFVSASTPAHTAARAGTFAALRRYPTYRRLWFGMLAAASGQWMQQVGLGWLALSLTDSPFFVGLVGFAAGLPFLVVPIPAGVLVDRFDRRRVLVVCLAAACVLAVVMAIDIVGGGVRPWHLLVAAFLNGSLQAITMPAQQSIVPSLVDRSDLTNAIGLNSAGMNVTRSAGPFIAGGMIGIAGVGSAFVLQAIALCLALWLIATLRLPERTVKPAIAGLRGSLEGVTLIGRRPDLRALFLLACIPTLFVFPYISFRSCRFSRGTSWRSVPAGWAS